MIFALSFGPVLALLTANAPASAGRTAAHVPRPAQVGSPPPVQQSNTVNIFSEFNVTPYCTLSAPSSDTLLNFGSAPGNVPVGTLFTANVTLLYFCDFGGGPQTPLFSIADEFATGTPTYIMTGDNVEKQINFQMCPAGSYGGSGTCSANYINSPSASVASPLSPSGTAIPIVGYFFTQTSPLVVDFYGDDLTAVIYF
jgi:hypothetical protein